MPKYNETALPTDILLVYFSDEIDKVLKLIK